MLDFRWYTPMHSADLDSFDEVRTRDWQVLGFWG